MKLLSVLLSLALMLSFTGCQSPGIEPSEPIDILSTETNPAGDSFGQVAAYIEDPLTSIIESYDNPLVFTTTEHIHETLPEFTFTRIAGGIEDTWNSLFPDSREVSIIVTDDKGGTIQVINNLSQSDRFINEDIRFDDYNFDGYLDMRLLRWQEGAGQLRATEYFWLWDAETSQFMQNNQLSEIGYATVLDINSSTNQIVVIKRIGGDFLSRLFEYYEFQNNAFELVFHEQHLYIHDGNYQLLYTEITRTDVRTGETTFEIEPAP